MVHLPAGDWVTVADAAAILGRSRRRVQSLVASGSLKATRVSARVYLLLRADVEAFAKVDRPRGRPKGSTRKKKGKRK